MRRTLDLHGLPSRDRPPPPHQLQTPTDLYVHSRYGILTANYLMELVKKNIFYCLLFFFIGLSNDTGLVGSRYDIGRVQWRPTSFPSFDRKGHVT